MHSTKRLGERLEALLYRVQWCLKCNHKTVVKPCPPKLSPYMGNCAQPTACSVCYLVQLFLEYAPSQSQNIIDLEGPWRSEITNWNIILITYQTQKGVDDMNTKNDITILWDNNEYFMVTIQN